MGLHQGVGTEALFFLLSRKTVLIPGIKHNRIGDPEVSDREGRVSHVQFRRRQEGEKTSDQASVFRDSDQIAGVGKMAVCRVQGLTCQVLVLPV